MSGEIEYGGVKVSSKGMLGKIVLDLTFVGYTGRRLLGGF